MRRQQLRKATAPEGGLKKETGDRRQETGGKLHGDSLPQVMREHPR
ncbi:MULTISPECIES: hypothetical protein [Okeania]|nr:MULTISPECIES: hypothetical protein [Okeania]NET19640.1 hypothetical protein [Okeania sp. SIO1H5]NEP86768.1 hypothetical protein [Okeania sp. SIO2C2]NES79139.1 hypothetical protein [Okeania sp. SIO1H4]NET74685.1 hypothetical protein [Okeania sp. SIO1F9]NET97139.1 hypothetical protein [Okeania sp. SIO1H2]